MPVSEEEDRYLETSTKALLDVIRDAEQSYVSMGRVGITEHLQGFEVQALERAMSLSPFHPDIIIQT